MPEFAPGFAGGTDNSVLPKNTQPLQGRYVTNALVSTTVGAAPGTLTTVNRARVKHDINIPAKPIIEIDVPINRASTAADVTAMKTKFTKKKASFTFVRDLSGNGGGAFTRS